MTTVNSFWNMIRDAYRKFINLDKIDDKFEARVVEICRNVVTNDKINVNKLGHNITQILKFEPDDGLRFDITFDEFIKIVNLIAEIIPFRQDFKDCKQVFTNRLILSEWYNTKIKIKN